MKLDQSKIQNEKDNQHNAGEDSNGPQFGGDIGKLDSLRFGGLGQRYGRRCTSYFWLGRGLTGSRDCWYPGSGSGALLAAYVLTGGLLASFAS
jgi:hypothetical protein